MDALNEAKLKYAIGSVVNASPLSLKIETHIKVQEGRRSQIFTAIVEKVEPNSSISETSTLLAPGSRVLVKMFDYDLLAVYDDDSAGSPADVCIQVYSAETKIYDRLTTLHGAEIPHFYLACTCGRYQTVVLEYIHQSSLLDYSVETKEEMETIKAATRSAVGKLHANGVYHGDIQPSNILWSSATRRVVLVDFEKSKTFGENDLVSTTWKEIDDSDLEYVLQKIYEE